MNVSGMLSSIPLSEDIPLDPAALIRIGTVLAVDLVAARCSVQIGDPEAGAIETPDIKWGASRVGKTRIWSPPVVGEQVLVAFPAGEVAAGIIITSIACNLFPPASDQHPDLIAFEDGTTVSYDAEQHLMTISTANGGVRITASEGITITGPVTITGDVSVDGQITSTGDMVAGDISLINHLHGNVAAGTAKTGAPE
ncbi:phage baseplate assembly protein V [Parasphingorhabdus sp. JC815]|uniref:phage baseplate assembly protein V n=1 Tax=Parasphingorhabdus sp. JC815 TaxID=3232140 RepID=UPI003459D712